MKVESRVPVINQGFSKVINSLLLFSILISGCAPGQMKTVMPDSSPTVTPVGSEPTPLPTRPAYRAGELVDYIVQTGDTIPALASHFNTSIEEIREANPFIPNDATTLPPGMPMQIPIYYRSLWGSSFHILPDSLFINGPAQQGFDTVLFVNSQPGWLKDYRVYAGGTWRQGGEVIDYVAQNFSLSPRLLLAIIEYQTGALSASTPPESAEYPLGYASRAHQGLYRQLVWAANTLNNGYYGWRSGTLISFDHKDGSMESPDPWQNAATVGLQYYYAQVLDNDAYTQATHNPGFLATYASLFGDPWNTVEDHIPGSLTQPPMTLPFQSGKAWAFTGGPHTGWGEGQPWAALDFAPPAVIGGCIETDEWATAVADGIIARSSPAEIVLDIDGDGDERTGWVVFYLHLATKGRAPEGTILHTGDPVGHPSCEGGRSTGTHVHIARKFNGEWIPASGPLAFNLEGWTAQNGAAPYEGSLVRFSHIVQACVCSDVNSQIIAGLVP